MRLSPFLLLALALVLASCGKKDATTPQASEPVASQSKPSSQDETSAPAGQVQDNQPAPPARTQARTVVKQSAASANQPPAQPVPAAVVLDGVVHPVMTMELQKYIQKTGRMPKDFSEFAGSSIDSVPFAPEGMEYVIDYANKQVKVVKIKKR